jgi:hypothetical protein
MKMRTSSKILSTRPVESYVELEYKREKFLERNRAAASKCREKKKLSTSNLEERARELTWQRHMVTQHIALLRNEFLELKCKCLEHTHCDCEQIREYLRSTVAQLNPVGSLCYQISDSHRPLVSLVSPPLSSHDSVSIANLPNLNNFQLSSLELDANSESDSRKLEEEEATLS